jgi:hypothetical protein
MPIRPPISPPRRLPRRPGVRPRAGQGRLRLRLAASLLAVVGLLQGCRSPLLQPRQTLHVVVVPTETMDWLGDVDPDHRLRKPLFDAFHRLHPGVSVDLSLVSQDLLPELLDRGNRRGLAPDLVLLRAPMAVSLVQRGLLDPLPAGDPTIRRTLGLVVPRMLAQVRTSRGLAGLPALSEPSLACYDRRRIAAPPTSVDALLTLAASGRSVGLAVDPVGLWWTAGAFGAHGVLLKSFIGVPGPRVPVDAAERLLVERWLSWLRQASLQSRVELASGQQDLIRGLEGGSLAWIPCFSLTLPRLERSLGRHLGVSALPGGPGGPPSPFIASRTWAFGRNSSPRQRALAVELAAMSLNPLVQRDLMINSRAILPANRFVPVPVASSGRLGAMAQAMEQFTRTAPPMEEVLSADRLRRLMPPMETAVADVMLGVMTPQQAVDILVNLRFLR